MGAAPDRRELVGPGLLWQMKRDFQIAFLRDRGLAPRHRLLDLGCGVLRGGIPLIEYLDPGHYTGVEVRAVALAEACRELEEAGLGERAPTLILSGDLGAIPAPPRFDFIWAFSVLFHMSDEVVRSSFELAARALARDGALFANVHLGERRPGRWQGFPVLWRERGAYEEMAAAAGLAVESLGELRHLGHVSGMADADRQEMLRLTPRPA